MFFDARSLDVTVLETDVCIVGAGAAGITVACQLANTSISVLLLKSGGFELDADTQSLAQGENVSFEDFPLEATRLRFFGGTTNHWAGVTYRMDAADLAARPDMPLSGWPITYDELVKYYPAAEQLCQLGGAEWGEVDRWQRATGHDPLRMARGLMVPSVFFCSPPTRFGVTYRGALKAATNVKVLLYANAREIIATDTVSHVDQVEVQCIGGRRFSVRAKVFVLALGGLETARLLLLSRAQAPAGLGNINDNVGRYYMDHPGVSGGLLYLSAGAPDYGFFEDTIEKDGRHVAGVFLPKPGTLEREGIGHFRVTLGATALPPAGIESARKLEHLYNDPEAWADLGRHLANVLLDIDQVANLLSKNVFGRAAVLTKEAGGAVGGRTAYCVVFAEQFPNPDSRVTLSHESDLFGQPRIRLDWRLQEVDLRTLRRGTEIFAASVAACGHGRVRLTGELLNSDFRDLVDVSCHHMGTTRMSDDPRTGVVDSDLRVHGIDNLYIASSSTYPTGSWQNPTLTIVALAVRVAAHVQRHFI